MENLLLGAEVIRYEVSSNIEIHRSVDWATSECPTSVRYDQEDDRDSPYERSYRDAPFSARP